MEKPVECKACRRWFRASGEWGLTREVPRIINCPNCGAPNEVEWPENMEVHSTR